MNLLKGLTSRRSVAKLTDALVPSDMIDKIIKAGTFAPTHKRTEPWRFVVFTGEGRQALSDAMVAGFKQANPKSTDIMLEKITAKPYRAPALIMVWCAAGRGKKNPPVWEDQAAVAACLQNMSLATHALALGAIWRTGNMVNYTQVQALCQSDDDCFDHTKGDRLMGVLYIGRADRHYSKPQRVPLPAKVRYLHCKT